MDKFVDLVKEKFEDGDIIPNPDYQRDYVYDDKKASLLVESILLRIIVKSFIVLSYM